MRKVIQIAGCPDPSGDGKAIALCDDGSMFSLMLYGGLPASPEWEKLPPIPQDEEQSE